MLKKDTPKPLKDSHSVIDNAVKTFGIEKCTVAWTGGKDSTLMLWLVRSYCKINDFELPTVIFIDEGDPFPEIESFTKELQASWSFSVHVLRNKDVLSQVKSLHDMVRVDLLNAANKQELKNIGFNKPAFPFDPESKAGNHLMKTTVLKDFIKERGVKALFTAIRRDEHPSRANETPLSERSDPEHTRVHPILHFTERDIWDITREYSIPYCNLYEQGYRSLGTRSGTLCFSNLPAWEQDLENTSERGGRDQDKEEIMSQLRSLGYM